MILISTCICILLTIDNIASDHIKLVAFAISLDGKQYQN